MEVMKAVTQGLREVKYTIGQFATPLGQALPPCMKYTKVGIACIV